MNVQQCFVFHGVLVKKHGGMIHGIDETLNVGETVLIVVVTNNDVCLK